MLVAYICPPKNYCTYSLCDQICNFVKNICVIENLNLFLPLAMHKVNCNFIKLKENTA